MGSLVKETLTEKQVRELLDMANVNSPKWKYDNHLNIYKGYFIAWDGEKHEGCIVLHHKGIHEKTDYYFMEVELKEVNMSESGHTYKATYHMLMPISERKQITKFCSGNTHDLCNYIINNATVDTWDYYKVPMTKKEIQKAKETYSYSYIMNDYTKPDMLTYSELSYWHTPLTFLEKEALLEEKKRRETELLALFSKGNLPKAEDDIWYEILCNPIETEIIKILRSQGYSVRIDGERDSFGWVTRGIFVNGKMMCLY